MSIRYKLTLIMLGISVAAVLLTALSITSYLIFDMRKSAANELSVTAAVTADRNAAAVMFLDNERASKNLELFRLNPAIRRACIYDAQGALFAGYVADGALPNEQCAPSRATIAPVTDGWLSAMTDMSQNGSVVGSVRIVSDTREIDAYVQKSLIIGGTASGFVVFITMLATLYFQRTISAPILELAATAESITESRNYTLEARAAGNDETGKLARAFNNMIAEVRKRDEELTAYNETLEQKVAVRTKELEESKRKAEMANEAKSEFLRNMSHEFRTPLHALISFSAYGIKEHETAERGQLKQYFDMIQKGAHRLTKLVNEVLDLAKLEHGEDTLVLRSTDMTELAGRAAELVTPLVKEKNIHFQLVHGATAPRAVCDADKIIQVLTNLLGNAIKFTPSGKGILLKAEMLEGGTPTVSISVQDEGIGIPAGEEALIFESFRQSSRTNTGAGGTGLGLAICKRIVTAHGGQIWAENRPEGGARVTFTFPANLQEGKRTVHTTQEGVAA